LASRCAISIPDGPFVIAQGLGPLGLGLCCGSGLGLFDPGFFMALFLCR
jgi:hypothetical protein